MSSELVERLQITVRQPNESAGDLIDRWRKDRADALARIEALEADNARLRRCVDDQIQAEFRARQELMRVQAADDWYYKGRPIVEIANEAIGFERALEVIAGSHWERVGYCQSDVEDITDLTAIEAQSHARATLQKFRAARRALTGGKNDG